MAAPQEKENGGKFVLDIIVHWDDYVRGTSLGGESFCDDCVAEGQARRRVLGRDRQGTL